MSGRITYWVIDTVAAEMKDWMRAHPQTHIGINIPPEILGRGGIEYAANNSGLLEHASQIILEITERGVPDLLGIQAINGNWGGGAKLALDDVTHVGGANLSVLARCNMHMIKIDGSLVAQISPDSPAPTWLAGISHLIKASQLEVIAEGVETAQQLAVLRDAGIQMAQGYHFSRPITASAFIAFHAQNNRD